MPEELRDKEFYKLAVQQNGQTLKCVPDELKDYELCKLAVQQNGQALKHVPEELRDNELCRLAIQQEFEKFDKAVFSLIPEKFRTEELCELAFSIEPAIAELIPKNLFKSKVFILRLLKISPIIIHFIDPNFIDNDMADKIIDYYRDKIMKEELDKGCVKNLFKLSLWSTKAMNSFIDVKIALQTDSADADKANSTTESINNFLTHRK